MALEDDDPLSIAANIAGILTFVVAILAAVYVRVTYLRNSDAEYFKVKTSLSWYKTESTWLAELVRAAADLDVPGRERRHSTTAEFQMYSFVMDDLVRLEQRLLELIKETETRAAAEGPGTEAGGGGEGGGGRDGKGGGQEDWTLIPRSWGWGWGWGWTRTSVAMAWLPIRTKALELVRQRDALTARVMFTQMSMIASRIRDLEHRANWREAKGAETMMRLEEMIAAQQGEIRRLEDLVYRVMHRQRVGGTTVGGGVEASSSPPGSPLASEARSSPRHLTRPNRRPSLFSPDGGGGGSGGGGNEYDNESHSRGRHLRKLSASLVNRRRPMSR